jgi:hypothetical protein
VRAVVVRRSRLRQVKLEKWEVFSLQIVEPADILFSTPHSD